MEIISCDNQQVRIFKLGDIHCSKRCICRDIEDMAISIEGSLRDKIYWCIIDPNDAKGCNLDNYICTHQERERCPDLLILKRLRKRRRSEGESWKCVVVELKTNVRTDDLLIIMDYIIDAYEKLMNETCVPPCCRDKRKAIVLPGIRRIINRVRRNPKGYGYEVLTICKDHICIDDVKQFSSSVAEIYGG